ncbi:MAG: hypothetical protein WDO16_07705 [Bacteroidota bacterium]
MFTLNCKGQLLVVDKPLVMGIINATPDSFMQKAVTMVLMLFCSRQNKC